MSEEPATELPITKQSENPIAPRPFTVKPSENPIGQGEPQIVGSVDTDGNPAPVLKDIAVGRGENMPSDRARSKSKGAITLIGQISESPTEEVLAKQVEKKIVGFRGIIGSDSTQIYADGELGEIVIDDDDNLVIPNMSPRSQSRIIIDYATTAAAVSALYTSSPDVGLLPPEAYKIALTGLRQRIDDNGIILTVAGGKARTKTRFYSIPGKQLNDQRKPIPLYEQRILVVQDMLLENGDTRRIYAVSTAADLEFDLDQAVKLQLEQNPNTTAAKPSETQTNNSRQSQLQGEGSMVEQTGQSPDAARELDIINRLADAVLAGTSKQEALQNYVKHAKQKGVPREEIIKVLKEKGIDIRQPEKTPKEKLEDIAGRISPFLDRLRQKFPDQPGEDGRLDIEIPVSPEDVGLINDAVNVARNILMADPRLQRLDELIQTHTKQDKGFDASRGYGLPVVYEDRNIQSPRVGVVDNRTVLLVPPETYKLYRGKRDLDNAAAIINVTPGFRGRPASWLLRPLEQGIKTALES